MAFQTALKDIGAHHGTGDVRSIHLGSLQRKGYGQRACPAACSKVTSSVNVTPVNVAGAIICRYTRTLCQRNHGYANHRPLQLPRTKH